MNTAKRTRLEKAGWKIGTTAEFLGLSPAESARIETKLLPGQAPGNARTRKRLSRTEVTKPPKR